MGSTKEIFQFNHFVKSEKSKTGYSLRVGEAIYSEKVYLILPHYIHKRSPAFSLVRTPGQHVSGFFPSGIENWFFGDDRQHGLLLHLREAEFELWKTNLTPVNMRETFISGQLGEVLSLARKKAVQGG